MRTSRALVAAAVAVQVVVPLAALLDGPPSRFGFHMYSGHAGLGVRALDRDGQPVELDLHRWVARGRGELDWSAVLPERICASEPTVVEVTVTSGGRERTLRCPD